MTTSGQKFLTSSYLTMPLSTDGSTFALRRKAELCAGVKSCRLENQRQEQALNAAARIMRYLIPNA
jgi:hypothetical protein